MNSYKSNIVKVGMGYINRGILVELKLYFHYI